MRSADLPPGPDAPRPVAATPASTAAAGAVSAVLGIPAAVRARRRRQLAVAATGAVSLHLAVAAGVWPAPPAPPEPIGLDARVATGRTVELRPLAPAPAPDAPAAAAAPSAAPTPVATPRPAPVPPVGRPDGPGPAAVVASAPSAPRSAPPPAPRPAPVHAPSPASVPPPDPSPAADATGDPVAATGAAEAASADAPAADEPRPLQLAQAAAGAPPLRVAGADGAPKAPSVPVYPVRLPAARVLAYDLMRGALSGTGELRWEPDGDRYRAQMTGRIAGFTILQWTSTGRLDRTGLAPVRFTDRRTGGREHAANFVRDDGVVRYSGPQVEHPLPAAGQDRLSWMVQIAAVVRARAEPPVAGDRVLLWVSGARGDADVWSFRVLGPSTVSVGGTAVATLALLREPREPHDTRVEVWLDPSRDHLPVRARLVQGRAEDALELTLQPPR